MHDDALFTFYFDRYQRFRHAAECIEAAFGPAARTVLDLGGHDDTLALFLKGREVTPCDSLVGAAHGGLDMADGAFDVAVALDVLEHVGPADRPMFLAELARVARLGVVVAFPVPEAAEAERFVLEITGSAWLAQHQEHGLPDPADVERELDRLALSWERHPNACLASWTPMMLLMHGVEKDMRLRISEFFNRHYYTTENREPAYRAVYVCHKGE